MRTITVNGKAYEVDDEGFLLDFDQWDKEFARVLALQIGITNDLTQKHWEVINYISNAYKEDGKCPLVYQTCRHTKLHLHALQKLFPTGYLRGACKLAGITYREGFVRGGWMKARVKGAARVTPEKTYGVDVRGFLVNPDDWDEQFAVHKAYELKISEQLSGRHWQIINYLRDCFKKNGTVPTVYETCDANHLDLEELERLFPDGYHRGAVKIAGLRVR
ncbi:MAG: TusE/DsrC/DsvC family sulfur relay protein [Candidatus Zixiibacteriota bacterium]|nr:MAG: TusE/DsrC/DsvC family sulfur relay protein [candidate division Zixibacteria bacterium]